MATLQMHFHLFTVVYAILLARKLDKSALLNLCFDSLLTTLSVYDISDLLSKKINSLKPKPSR